MEPIELNSTAQADYYARLAKAKEALPVFTKDTEGYGYSYVTLDAIQQKAHPILREQGLLLTHELHFVHISPEHPPVFGVTTTLLDVQGGYGSPLRSFFPINHQAKPQDVGSARSYGMRYNVTALLDLILVGEDDDGAQAQGSSKRTSKSGGGKTSKSKAKSSSDDDGDW
jgi:hypothetical protein